MAQHDYNIANASFPTVRSDINDVLSAINSSNSGTSRPSSAVAGTIWLDTSGAATAQLLKLYDGAADITLATVNFTANTVDFTDSSVTLALDDVAAGDAAVNLTTTSGNITIDAQGSDTDIIFKGTDGSSDITALTLDMSSAGSATFNNDVSIADDIFQGSDGANHVFGANNEIKFRHVHNEGINLIHTATGDNNPIKFTLQTGETDIAADDVLGAINFQAPDEATGTDAILVAAGIEAVSEGDFAADNNATKLSFKTASSETAAEKMSLSSTGVLTVNGAANVPQQALTSSSNAVAWDASAKPNAFHVTTENTTFSAPTNNVEGAFIALEINYNGSHTIAFNTIFEFAASTAPTFTSSDGKTDILVFRYNGAVWQEVGRTLNLSES